MLIITPCQSPADFAAAIGLYRSLGFREISAYRFNPDPTACCMELNLAMKAAADS